MNDPGVSVIFEAAFHIDGYTTRADVLRRHGNGWKILEVKSSLSDGEVKEELLDDLSYTVMVASRCGLNVTAASLLQIRRDFRRGSPLEEMFGETDLTEKINQRMAEFSSRWADARDATLLPKPPQSGTLYGVWRLSVLQRSLLWP